jgi:hypothetical protein
MAERTVSNVVRDSKHKYTKLANLRRDLSILENSRVTPAVMEAHYKLRRQLPNAEHTNRFLKFFNMSNYSVKNLESVRWELMHLSKTSIKAKEYLAKLNATPLPIKKALKNYKGIGHVRLREARARNTPGLVKAVYNSLMSQLKNRSKGLNTQVLYRGLKSNRISNNMYLNNSVSSWSSNKNIAKYFAKENGIVIMIPKNVMGTNPYIKYQNYLNENNDEKEYILPPGKFKLSPANKNNVRKVIEFTPRNSNSCSSK